MNALFKIKRETVNTFYIGYISQRHDFQNKLFLVYISFKFLFHAVLIHNTLQCIPRLKEWGLKCLILETKEQPAQGISKI